MAGKYPIELEYEDPAIPSPRQEHLDMQMRRVKDYYRRRGLSVVVANDHYYKMLARTIKECREAGSKCTDSLNTEGEDDEDTPLDMKEMKACIDDVQRKMCQYRIKHGHPGPSSSDRPRSIGRGMSASSCMSQDYSLQDFKLPRRLGVNYFPDYEVRRPGMRSKASVEKEKKQ